MKRKKKINSQVQISRWTIVIALSVMCLFGAGYWYSYTGIGDAAEANPGKSVEEQESKKEKKKNKKKDKEKKKKKKKKYKSKAETTEETEDHIIRNADTPHEYKVDKEKKGKKRKAEKEPDLSKSMIKGEILEGDTILYTITLKNKGNANATDIDVLNIIDPRFSAPEKIQFKKCGKKAKYSFDEEGLELNNLKVKKKKNCKITYEVTTADRGAMSSQLLISPASEGGEEIGPISAKPLQLHAPIEEAATIAEPVITEVSSEELGEPQLELESEQEDEEEIEESVIEIQEQADTDAEEPKNTAETPGDAVGTADLPSTGDEEDVIQEDPVAEEGSDIEV